MPTRNLCLALFVAISTLVASAEHCRQVDVDKSSGFCTTPDHALTPGEMDASLACVTNSERPRAVTEAEKNHILSAYGWPANTKKSSGEFDHWFPHWMGGSDGPKNIWFEPHAGNFGSYAKDKVELMLWRKVCVDKSMTLSQAQTFFLPSWLRIKPRIWFMSMFGI